MWWLNAESTETLSASLATFALEYKIKLEEEGKSTEDLFKILYHRLESTDRRWLFIFDNAENEQELAPYLPSQNKNRHILITSRYKDWKRIATPLTVELFSKKEASNFLTRRTGLPENEFQNALAKKLGYLSLALEQAAAFICHNDDCNYETYLKLLDKYHLKPFRDYPDEATKQSVHATWDISFQKITNESSKQLLYLCTFFAPDNIYIAWFTDAHECLPSPLKETVMDDYKYIQTKTELAQYSLVTLKDGKLSLHRLVQEVVKDSLSKEIQTGCLNVCVQILDKLRYPGFSTTESRVLFNELAPHVFSVTEQLSLETETIASLYFFLGYGYKELADYNQALKWFNKALAIYEKVLGKEHPDTATIYNNIALVYNIQGKYDEAIKLFYKTLSIVIKVFGMEHPDTGTICNNIGLVYYNKGEYNEAMECYNMALTIREKVLGREDPDTATTYNNIGLVYNYQGRYDEALKWYDKALTIAEKVLGKEDPRTARIYNNIALIYYHQGRYDEALKWYDKTLTIKEKVLGKEHPGTATTYNNIADVYENQGKFDEALEWNNKALTIREKVLGKEHPDTKNTIQNLKLLHKRKQDK